MSDFKPSRLCFTKCCNQTIKTLNPETLPVPYLKLRVSIRLPNLFCIEKKSWWCDLPTNKQYFKQILICFLIKTIYSIGKPCVFSLRKISTKTILLSTDCRAVVCTKTDQYNRRYMCAKSVVTLKRYTGKN